MPTPPTPSPASAGPTRKRPAGERRRLRRTGWAAAAATLAGLALTNHLLARRSERRRPPDGKFIMVKGVRLHYREAGSGAPVVLLHGNGLASDDFLVSGLLGDLARTRRVIAFDRPGFGHSERPRDRDWRARAQAELLNEALALMGVERPLIVGHSWGTLVAVEMALAAPEGLPGLVLMSGYYRPSVRPDALLMGGPAVPLAGDLLRFTVSPVLGRLATPLILKQVFAPAPVSGRFRRSYPISQSLRPSQIRASAAEAVRVGPDAARLAPRLHGLPTPTLIILGAGDRLIDPAYQSGWLLDELPDASLLAVEGAGHMVHHTAPDAVAEAIEAFATTAEPTRGRARPLEPLEAPAGPLRGP